MGTVNLLKRTKVYLGSFFNHSSRCLLCGTHQPRLICQPCDTLLTRAPGNTCRCGLPQPHAVTEFAPLCGRCLRRPPAFRASHHALRYDFPVDSLINRYKHRGALETERALDTLLRETTLPWQAADALCPLPAHWRREWQRGFDQTERLARSLSQLWQRPLCRALVRARATSHQQGLTRQQRQRNLRGAFRLKAPVAGMNLLLIDDVMTTGSTARAAAHTLLAGGAREVQVWTLARALKPATA